MRRISRSAAVLVGALVAMAFGVTPASAATTGEAYMNGTGTSMSGIFLGVIDTAPAACDMQYFGGSLECNGSVVTGGSVAISCAVSSTPLGAVVVLTGSCTGTAAGSLTMLCRAAPVSGYVWSCDVSIA